MGMPKNIPPTGRRLFSSIRLLEIGPGENYLLSRLHRSFDYLVGDSLLHDILDGAVHGARAELGIGAELHQVIHKLIGDLEVNAASTDARTELLEHQFRYLA